MKFKIGVDSGGVAICDLDYIKQFIKGDPKVGHVIDAKTDMTHIEGSVTYMGDIKGDLHFDIVTPSKKIYIGDVCHEEHTPEMWEKYCAHPIGGPIGIYGKEVRMGGDGKYIFDIEVDHVTQL